MLFIKSSFLNEINIGAAIINNKYSKSSLKVDKNYYIY